jgi:hypothetical protein
VGEHESSRFELPEERDVGWRRRGVHQFVEQLADAPARRAGKGRTCLVVPTWPGRRGTGPALSGLDARSIERRYLAVARAPR